MVFVKHFLRPVSPRIQRFILKYMEHDNEIKRGRRAAEDLKKVTSLEGFEPRRTFDISPYFICFGNKQNVPFAKTLKILQAIVCSLKHAPGFLQMKMYAVSMRCTRHHPLWQCHLIGERLRAFYLSLCSSTFAKKADTKCV